MYGYYGAYPLPSGHGYGRPFGFDYNRDGLITAADFAIGARSMGWGPIGEDVARSAFRAYDRNNNGYLDYNDAYGAYGSLYRLYH